MQKRKLFSGIIVRRMREEGRITQADLAQKLDISASYLNQIEHDQRPLTANVLIALSRVFRVDVATFSDDGRDRLLYDLKDALADPAFGGVDIPASEVKVVAQSAPTIARALVTVQGAHRAVLDRYQSLDSALEAAIPGQASVAPNLPYDEVRDFFHSIGNYVEQLDEMAEDIADKMQRAGHDIRHILLHRHVVTVEQDSSLDVAKPIRRFDPNLRILYLDMFLGQPTQSFAMAHQLALLEAAAQIDAVVDAAGFKSHDAKAVCMVALANYFAGAVILPYGRFLAAATEWRYDIGALAATFGASQEQVCHRLSTMQRPGMEGIPFYFLRVDRAGNITKRHSATRFQFARYGGACPLWNVHEAFEASDRHLVQVAEMPDGVRYLSIALAITKRGTTAASPTRRYAIGFGCELAYADRVVYADGIDLRRPQTVVPIGISCRLCDRNDCAQRAFPPIGSRLTINPNQRMEVPYEHSGPSKKLNAP